MAIHVICNPAAVAGLKDLVRDETIVANSPFLIPMLKKRHVKNPINASGYRGIFVYFYFVIKSKIFKTEIIVYHEANNYFFDIYWLLFKPLVIRKNYYSLSDFEKITLQDVSDHKFGKLIHLLGLTECFEFFRSQNDYGNKPILWFRVKTKYCLSSDIIVHDFSIDKAADRNILFLTGKDLVGDKELKLKFLELITLIKKKKLKFAIKDHPNPNFRIWSMDEIHNIGKENFIDPEISSEELVKNYRHAIGLGSSGIISFACPISLYKLFPESEGTAERISYLRTHAKMRQGKVNFPESIVDISRILDI